MLDFALYGNLRLGIFISLLTLLMFIEHVRPWRSDVRPLSMPSLRNIVLAGMGALAGLIRPIAPVLFAINMQSYPEIGLFNWLGLDGFLGLVGGWLLLDGMIWFQHWLMHRISWLWRLHAVHHSETQLNASSGVRFHPLEIIFSLAFKCCVIALLGLSVETVMLFEIVLSAAALITHANFPLPDRLDRALRSALVTPQMHRIHHSVEYDRTNSNYGNVLSIWDRVFGTYIAGVQQTSDPLGLPEVRQHLSLWQLLYRPFRRFDK